MTPHRRATATFTTHTALAILALCGAAAGQTPIATFDGPGTAFGLGNSVGSGDFDGDGRADVVAGAPFANPTGDEDVFYLGAVRAYSGLDGSLLFSFDGDEIEDFVGDAVAGAGDCDGDGSDDIVVGAPTDSLTLGAPKTGVVRVFSGATGSLLFSAGGVQGDRLGEVVAAAGDVNADGFDDVIAGAPRALDLVGEVVVYSGQDGSVLYTVPGAGSDDFFGRAVSGAGDVDGDGFDDFVASAPSNKLDHGYTRVYSGATGAILHDVLGDPRSVGGAGDVNGDGHADFIVGEPTAFPNGRARVLSGLDASTIHTFESPVPFAQFGAAVAGIDDVDGDGIGDIVVGARGLQFSAPAGFVDVYSGSDGRMLHRFDGQETQLFGIAVAGGDVDGDGFEDIVVGAPLADVGAVNSGTVSVFPGSEVLGSTFCASLANSSGAVAALSARGSLAASPLNVRFDVTDLPSTTQGILFFGPGQLAGAPFGDGLRCVGGAVQRVLPPVAGMVGQARVVLNAVAPYASGITPGADLNFQFWFRDAMAMMAGFNTSDARNVVFE